MDKKAQALNKFLKLLKKQFKNSIKKIFLFNSYTKKNYNKKNNINILIIKKINFNKIIKLITNILLKYKKLINPILLKPNKFKKKNNNFIKTIKTKNIPLKI